MARGRADSCWAGGMQMAIVFLHDGAAQGPRGVTPGTLGRVPVERL